MAGTDEPQSCGKINLNPQNLKILCCFSLVLFWNPRVCSIFLICLADNNDDWDWAKDSVLSGNAPPPKGRNRGQPSFVLTVVHLHACMDNLLPHEFLFSSHCKICMEISLFIGNVLISFWTFCYYFCQSCISVELKKWLLFKLSLPDRSYIVIPPTNMLRLELHAAQIAYSYLNI